MPTAQYSALDGSDKVVANMPTPKHIGRIMHWYRGARKVIKNIPPEKDPTWCIANQETQVEWVKFTLFNMQTKIYRILIIFRVKTRGGL